MFIAFQKFEISCAILFSFMKEEQFLFSYFSEQKLKCSQIKINIVMFNFSRAIMFFISQKHIFNYFNNQGKLDSGTGSVQGRVGRMNLPLDSIPCYIFSLNCFQIKRDLLQHKCELLCVFCTVLCAVFFTILQLTLL